MAPGLVVVDQTRRPGAPREVWEERPLADDSRWPVFKRYLTADDLAAELGGEVLLDTPPVAMVRTRRTAPRQDPAVDRSAAVAVAVAARVPRRLTASSDRVPRSAA